MCAVLSHTHSCMRFKGNLYSFSRESMCVKSVTYGPSYLVLTLTYNVIISLNRLAESCPGDDLFRIHL